MNIAYIRVSSRAQDFPTQKAAIERLAALRGDEIGAWYAEKLSAKTMGRPELARVRQAAQAGGIGRLYVFRLDRLTRTGIADTLHLLEEFKRAAVEVVSVADGFDLNGPTAEIIIAVMAWAAKMERLAINERIAAARERFAAEGRPWGHPPRMTAGQIEDARRLRGEGRTIREIARALGLPRSIVGRAVKAAGGLACAVSAPAGQAADNRLPRADGVIDRIAK